MELPHAGRHRRRGSHRGHPQRNPQGADQFGIKGIDHWTGRKASENRRQLSRRTGLVVFMCDRANHMLMRNVRKQAEDLGIPMVFCRHSATEVRERLDELGCSRCASSGRAELRHKS
jgi:hypothetical protein